ncbi:helix-turn-helix domain-containing protein [Massilia sp. W12]|uniref:GlxA family transcriptional regulator n=1 Tax=Massilia sp. W12 TaxID=3126507 RepID=UPI0030D30CB2
MYDFTLILLEGQLASNVALVRDMLYTAGEAAPMLGLAAPRWRICSLQGGILSLQGGFAVQTQALPQDPAPHELWIVPGLALRDRKQVMRRQQDPDFCTLAARLRQHGAAGGKLAVGCSAVFLLQQAGMLDGRSVTTTWWLAPLLQKMAPACRVDADRILCEDGPLLTSGAAFALIDLMLHLLRAYGGNELAQMVSRLLLLDARSARQAAFIVPEMMSGGDTLIANLSKEIETALPDVPGVSQLAQKFCMSERTLARRVRKATGKSTIALIQSIRLRRARALLENSRMSVEQVAAAVGYQDATALRKMMRKVSGAKPSQARQGAYVQN